MRPVPCAFGEVTLISLDRFLDMLSIKIVGDKEPRQEFNTLTNNGPFGGSAALEYSIKENEDTASYSRKSAYLFSGDKRTILKAALFYQAVYSHAYKTRLVELFDNMITNYITEFGEVQYLVRISPRTWMPANLADFQVMMNRKGDIGLACTAQVRTLITSISRMTVDQVLVEVKKIQGDFASAIDDINRQR